MAIFKVYIPITLYNGTNVPNKVKHSLYVEGEQSPTRDQVLLILYNLVEEDAGTKDYKGEWSKCIDTLTLTDNFPVLKENEKYNWVWDRDKNTIWYGRLIEIERIRVNKSL